LLIRHYYTSCGPTYFLQIHIENKVFLEVDSFSQQGNLTHNNFNLGKAMRGRERTRDEELRNTHQNTKTHKPRAKLQKIYIFIFIFFYRHNMN
jgi:midasin (ATPase involved in ribosome maturation)